MKWDQGLLTLFLTAGVTALTAAACGPSNTLVTVLPLPHGLRQMNVCANKIGSRESKAVGMGAATKDGAPAFNSTTAICKQVYDKDGNKTYKWSTENFGYKLGANDNKRMNIDVSIQILILQKSTEETSPIVKRIADLCIPQIEGLWPKQRLGSSLNLSIDPFVQDGSFQDRKQTSTSHLLILSGSENGGYAIDHWSDRARFTNSINSSSDFLACMAKMGKDPRASILCSSDAYPKIDAANSPFCAEVAVMVGHYLGLAQDLDPACGGTEAAAPGPKAVKLVAPVKTFMGAAARPENSGDNFFKNVVFTDSDRGIVIDRGCAIPADPATTAQNSAAATPLPRATPARRRFQPPPAPAILSTTGSGLAVK